MSTETKQINLHVEKGQNEVIIRHGAAEPVAAFRKAVKVHGTLEVPRVHLSNPPKWLTDKGFVVMGNAEQDSVLNWSYLEVDRERGMLHFVEDAGNEWENEYTGMLQLDLRFEKFGINSGRSYTTIELAHFIKMNRSHFETKDKAMLLVNDLRKFTAKVDQEIENHADERGNKKILKTQAVESNIPEAFKIKVPVFKGFPEQTLEVEISIDPGDLSCSLVSPEVNDYIESTKDDLIDAEIKAIEELHPTLRIFEV